MNHSRTALGVKERDVTLLDSQFEKAGKMDYVNRHGDSYYIFQGETKTGKPKYYASKRETSEKGVRADDLPTGFEIFESPSNAVVSVRRRRPSQILSFERDLVDRLAIELSAYSFMQTVVDGDRIIIYTPDSDPNEAMKAMRMILGPELSSSTDWAIRHMSYTANLRFILADVDQRTYLAERYCYRGSVDGWIQIGSLAPLESLARKLLSHLGRESWYDLN